jgi:hypothetical protein
MKKTITALFLAALVLPLAAQEPDKAKDKPAKPNPARAFKKLDADSDGFVSKDEFMKSPMATKNQERAAKVFTNKDKDKDGKLSKEEFTAGPKAPNKGGDKKKKPGA